ncbi:MAG: tyrosine-protein phosphatase [Halioglobus sp.]|nr:tyrosine-protein phosphatase [Halioglobus sp.]
MLINDSVHIWREPNGDYHVEWEASHPETRVTVEPLGADGAVTAHYDESTARARLAGLPQGSRHTFLVRDEHGNEHRAMERRLGMAGTPNFRDFGGYSTADGRRVKWGYLFRSGQLSALSESDVELLDSLELDLICDFRRVEEQESEPSLLPEQRRPRIASLPIVPGSNSRFFEEAEGQMSAGPQAMYDFMVEINRDFAEEQTATYSRMFREILDIDDARFLVHCAAGKDRTGFAAALVLRALGVPDEVVMADYLLTRRYFHPQEQIDRLRQKYDMEHMDADAIVPMLEVHEAYLERALTAIAMSYPSLEAYLDEALGVGPREVAELRRRYVE